MTDQTRITLPLHPSVTATHCGDGNKCIHNHMGCEFISLHPYCSVFGGREFDSEANEYKRHPDCIASAADTAEVRGLATFTLSGQEMDGITINGETAKRRRERLGL